MVWLSVHLLLSKVYVNSLLASLNPRPVQRGRGLDTNGHPLSVNLSSMFRHTPPNTETAIEFGNPLQAITSTRGSGKQTQAALQTMHAPHVHIIKTTMVDTDHCTVREEGGPSKIDDHPDGLATETSIPAPTRRDTSPGGDIDRPACIA
ncbi:hypothetical protein C8Q78DRAFT_230675 [Trametes maxima]|nr:hypothetical protein C8Q78DRAFT_230675 [Trametes maxima]